MKRGTGIGLLSSSVCPFFWLRHKGETHDIPSSSMLSIPMIRQYEQPAEPFNPSPGNRQVKGDRLREGETLVALLERHCVRSGGLSCNRTSSQHEDITQKVESWSFRYAWFQKWKPVV